MMLITISFKLTHKLQGFGFRKVMRWMMKALVYFYAVFVLYKRSTMIETTKRKSRENEWLSNFCCHLLVKGAMKANKGGFIKTHLTYVSGYTILEVA